MSTQYQQEFKLLKSFIRELPIDRFHNKRWDKLNLISVDELDASHEAWLHLIYLFTHPLEKGFFKPYWVMISIDSFSYYLDISDKRMPIYTWIYTGGEEDGRYHQIKVVDSILAIQNVLTKPPKVIAKFFQSTRNSELRYMEKLIEEDDRQKGWL